MVPVVAMTTMTTVTTMTVMLTMTLVLLMATVPTVVAMPTMPTMTGALVRHTHGIVRHASTLPSEQCWSPQTCSVAGAHPGRETMGPCVGSWSSWGCWSCSVCSGSSVNGA